jgi:hypothetical protein
MSYTIDRTFTSEEFGKILEKTPTKRGFFGRERHRRVRRPRRPAACRGIPTMKFTGDTGLDFMSNMRSHHHGVPSWRTPSSGVDAILYR